MNLTSKKSMLTIIAIILIATGVILFVYTRMQSKNEGVSKNWVNVQKAEYGKIVTISDSLSELQYPDFKILLNDTERTDTINGVDVKKAHFTITSPVYGASADKEVETEFTSAGPTFPKAFTIGAKAFKIRYGMFMSKYVDPVDGKVKDNPLKENEIIVETVASISDSSSGSLTFIKK